MPSDRPAVLTMTRGAAALADVLRAVDRLLAVHDCRFSERATFAITRRPGLASLVEADDGDRSRVVLLIGADDRRPGEFGARLDLP